MYNSAISLEESSLTDLFSLRKDKTMARLDLVLADTNAEYCDSLFKYFNHHYKERFRMDCFTDFELFIKHLDSESSTIDVLLISIDFLSRMAVNDIEEKVKVIVELKENSETSKTKYRYINKYGNADDMAQRLLDIYTDEYSHHTSTVPEFAGRKSFVIPVYSPEGGSGKTTIAVALSMMYAGMGKKPFYLNLEKYYSPWKMFNPSSVRGLSDILFHIRTKDTDIGAKINSYKITDPDYGVDYLSKVATPMDLEESGVQEVICLVKEMTSMELYDAIIVDTDGSLDLFKPEFIKLCHKIVVPYTDSGLGLSKLKSFIN